MKQPSRVLADIKKRVRPKPAPLGGSLRAALQDFLANRPAAFPPPPDCDDAPPPSDDEAQSGTDPTDTPQSVPHMQSIIKQPGLAHRRNSLAAPTCDLAGPFCTTLQPIAVSDRETHSREHSSRNTRS